MESSNKEGLITEIKRYLITKCQGLGRLLLAIRINISEEDIGTYASAGYKDINLYPRYFELPKLEQAGILLHELLHIALNHAIRASSLHPEIANIAMDLVINNLIKSTAHYVDLPKNGVFFENAPFHKALREKSKDAWETVELYYWLLDNLPKSTDGTGIKVDSRYYPSSSPNAKTGAELKATSPNDLDLKQASKLTDAEKSLHNCEMDRHLRELATNAGNDTNSLIYRLTKLCKASSIPWRQLFRKYIGEHLSHKREYNYNRPSNPYLAGVGIYEPSTKAKTTMKSIAVLTDTSGSMFYGDALIESLQIIEGLRKQIPTTLHIVSVDTEVKAIQTIRDTECFKASEYKPLEGGGGTCFESAIDYITKELRPTVIVGITDGYTNSWGNTKIPTYWVVTTDVECPYGKLIKYEP